MPRPPTRMKEMLALYDAGYSETEIKNMMEIKNDRIWYQYKRRFGRFLAMTIKTEDQETTQEPDIMPDSHAPVNPLMYEKNIGTDQSRLIDDLVRTKKLDKIRSYELKKMFRPIGDDRFTRNCLERLASKCRDMNLSWETSTDLGWKMRRRISRRFDKNLAESMVNELMEDYVRR